ncbi:MAG: hypothetical protein MUP61_03425 [Burkholderiales bacterium]|nr:hypothetical protein [Burkholderiales bacterium]MCJ7838253.1 hypothetical protein [Burkholderiales bacterium]
MIDKKIIEEDAREPVLDAVDRISEMLFGLFMALTLAQAHGYEIDPREKLLGLGAANLAAALQAAGVRLRTVAAHAVVRDILRAEAVEERLGRYTPGDSVADIIDEFRRGSEIAVPDAQV